MVRSLMAFAAGLILGTSVMALASSPGQARGTPASGSSIVQLRLYTIDKGRLDDFAAAWRAGVYPLRLKMGYQIPFAAKIPETNQFVWVLAYDGPESWERKEAGYYGSDERKRLSPDPAQWIARPEQLLVTPVVGLPSKGQ
jgi:hypothetical protein